MSVNPIEIPRRSLTELAEVNARLTRRVAQLEGEAARALHLAYHDALTGLPNRALLLDRLKQAMLHAMRQHRAVGVLFLDLDRFTLINDRLGHNVGDLLLRQVATRLSDCIRGSDTACRYGGDEFVVVLPDIRGAPDVEAVKQKVQAQLSSAYRLRDQCIAIGVSIGSAVFDSGPPNCNELIGEADDAMYRAKSARTRNSGELIHPNRVYSLPRLIGPRQLPR